MTHDNERVLAGVRPQTTAAGLWHWFPRWLPLVLVVLLSLVFFHSPGTSDVSIWLKRWAHLVQRVGMVEAFGRANGDYPPLGFVAVGLVGPVAALTGLEPFVVLKLGLFGWLCATTAVTYWTTRSPWGSAAMHAALTVSVMMLGYLDVMFAPFMLLSCHYLERDRPFVASVNFFFASMMKYQPLIVAPFFLLQVLQTQRTRRDAKALSLYLGKTVVAPLAALTLLVRAVFGPWTFGSFFEAITRHRWLSADALNLNWLFASVLHPKNALNVHVDPDSGWATPIHILFLAGYGYAIWTYARSRRDLESCVACASLGFLAYFTLNYGVHENHLFLPALLGLWLAIRDSPRFGLLCYWAFAANLNLILMFGFAGAGLGYQRKLLGLDLTVPFAALNVVMFFVTALLVRRSSRATPPTAPVASLTARS